MSSASALLKRILPSPLNMLMHAQRAGLGAANTRTMASSAVRALSVRAAPSACGLRSHFEASRLARAHPLVGRKFTVARAAAAEYGAETQESFEPTKQLFISNLSWNTDSDTLADHFAQLPGFSRAMVMMRDGKSRGMGLVEFETIDQASAAMQALNGSSLDGRMINVRESRPAPPGGRPVRERSERPERGERGDRGERTERPPAVPGATLYVANLNYRTRWQDLKDHFKAAGNVERATVATTPDGKSRGFGFVQFSSAEEARDAMDRMQGSELGEREIRVDVHQPRN